MNSATFLITAQADRFTVVRVSPKGEAAQRQGAWRETDDPPARQKALADALAELEYAGEDACLGLPSSLVLPAEIDRAGLPRTRRRTALLYRLEERLPVDAESLTIAFLPEVGPAVLGLAVETARVRSLLDLVERAGVQVAAICPIALLALAGSRRAGVAAPEYAVLIGDGTTDVLRLAGGVPVRWYTVSTEPAEWLRCLEVDQLTHPHDVARPRVECLGLPRGQSLPPGAAEEGVTFDRASEEPLAVLAARAARFVLGGRNPAWVDFRRDALALSHPWARTGWALTAAVTAGLALLVAMTATFALRGWQYANITDACTARQEQEYRRVFPKGDIPAGVSSRLRSEAVRMAALSGAGERPPEQASALETLRLVAGNLAPGVRVKITDLHLGPTELTVEGEVLSHTDAQLISQALGRADFVMDPPRTELRGPDNVSFTLTGRRGIPGPAAPHPPAEGGE
jgi:hypothetical protein